MIETIKPLIRVAALAGILLVPLAVLGQVSDLDRGLVAYYPFNGNANDESGNGHDGTVNGVTLGEDRFGRSDSAYVFNESTAIVLENILYIIFISSAEEAFETLKTN